MKRSFELVLPHVFNSEGGLSMDRNDRGNWTTGVIGKGELKGTNHGISAMSFPNVDIASLTKEKAESIYKKQYWDAVAGDDLPSGLDYSVFDFAVNSGAPRAVKFLQRLIGAKPDGHVGMKTLAALEGKDIVAIIETYNAKRLKFMKSLRTWNLYGNGWERRVNHVRDLSHDLSDGKIDGKISMPAIAPVAPVPAEGKLKTKEIVCKPEIIAGGVTALSGLLGAISDAPILQWGFVGAMIVGSVVGGCYVYNLIQQRESV